MLLKIHYDKCRYYNFVQVLIGYGLEELTRMILDLINSHLHPSVVPSYDDLLNKSSINLSRVSLSASHITLEALKRTIHSD